MTKQKRNLERRETTVREFRTITSENRDKKLGYQIGGIDVQTEEFNKLLESNEIALKKKLTAALEIKKMEATGMFPAESIRQEKIKLGILTESSSPLSGNGNVIDNLMMQLANEQDPVARASMMNTIAMMDMVKQSGGQNNPGMIMAMQNMNKQALPPKDDFKDKMLDMMSKKFLDEPKSELENLGKLKTLIEGVQTLIPQSNPLKDMKENLKLFQDMGIAITPGNSIEEKRLELDGKRLDKEMELEEKKIDADADRTKSLFNIGGDVLASAFAAAGASKETSKAPAGPSQEFIEDSLEAKCVNGNCGTPILITNSKTSRDVFCPKCDQKYQYQADKKQLFMMQEQHKN